MTLDIVYAFRAGLDIPANPHARQPLPPHLAPLLKLIIEAYLRGWPGRRDHALYPTPERETTRHAEQRRQRASFWVLMQDLVERFPLRLDERIRQTAKPKGLQQRMWYSAVLRPMIEGLISIKPMPKDSWNIAILLRPPLPPEARRMLLQNLYVMRLDETYKAA